MNRDSPPSAQEHIKYVGSTAQAQRGGTPGPEPRRAASHCCDALCWRRPDQARGCSAVVSVDPVHAVQRKQQRGLFDITEASSDKLQREHTEQALVLASK